MPEGEHFNLSQTVNAVWHALSAVVCRIGFDVAVHGLILALIVAAVGFILSTRKHKAGKPLLSVFRKLAIFCSILAVPGLVCLFTQGSLPPVNTLQLSSVGLLGFWCLVTLHLCMEEMNFQWFQRRESTPN
ncbi:MAG: hypothetical protein K2W82_03610 [Candidatus Obscuribacterales bacterium]|nr:hypothetical protein [Candidatus Obscuribacterales bacterium]